MSSARNRLNSYVLNQTKTNSARGKLEPLSILYAVVKASYSTERERERMTRLKASVYDYCYCNRGVWLAKRSRDVLLISKF
jgi:hypothetical protein